MMEAFTSSQVIYNTGIIGLAGFLKWLGLDAEAFGLFAILLFVDYVTGVAKAQRLGHKITSDKMKYGIISKLSLIIIPLVLAITAKAMKMPSENILFVGMNILILSEAYSIIGNIYAIRTKEELPEWDALAMLGKKIRNMLIKMSGGDIK